MAEVEPRGGGGLRLDEQETTSGPDGRFVFDGVTAGSHVVSARKDDLHRGRVWLRVRPGRGPVVLRMQRGATLRLRVVDEDGAPVAGDQAGVRVAMIDRRGRFQLDGVPPGDYVIETISTHRAKPVVASVTVIANQRATVKLVVAR